jgi:hypothetical protein
MKICIYRHPTHPDQRPLRPPKLNISVLVWSSFGGLRGLLSRCAGCLWMQLFMGAVPMTPSVSDFGGRRYHRFVPICRKNRPLSSIQFIIGENLLAVSLTPVNSLSAVSLTPPIRQSCVY